MKSLKRNGIFNTIYTTLSLIFPLLSAMYVARILTPAGVGKVSFAANYVSYFTTFSSLGIPNYGIREVAKRKDDPDCLNKFFSELLLINFITTSSFLLVYLVTVTTISRFKSDIHLYIASGFLIVLNYFNIDWLYQGSEEYGYIVARSFLTKFIFLIIMICYVKSQSNYVMYAWITSFAVAGNNIFNVIHSRKLVSLQLSALHIKKHMFPIMVMAAGVLVSTIYGKIDILMLGILTDEIHTGMYSYGYKIINILVSVCTAMTAVFMPRLSYLYNKDRRKFTEILDKGIELLVFLTVPVFVAVMVLADQIAVVLFGTEFLPAAGTIRVLSVLIIIKGIGNLLCYQLVICTGNEKERLPATIMASAVNVVLNLFMIKPLFEIGAAIASVISEIIVCGYQLFKMKEIVEMHLKYRNVAHSIISTLVMGGLVYIVTILGFDPLLTCVISFAVGVSSYFILNLMMGNSIALVSLYGIKKIISHLGN